MRSQVKLGQQERAAAPTTAASVASAAAVDSTKPAGLVVPPPGVPIYRWLFYEICKQYPSVQRWYLGGLGPTEKKMRCLQKLLAKNVCKALMLQVCRVFHVWIN